LNISFFTFTVLGIWVENGLTRVGTIYFTSFLPNPQFSLKTNENSCEYSTSDTDT
jgi:hypothetical protein